MRIRSPLLAAGATMFAMAFLHGSAQAAPKVWECGYAVVPYSRNMMKFYYSCSGKSFTETKARARAQCRRLNNCTLGACLPLDFTPRRTCGRE